MKVRLRYGRSGLEVEIPDERVATVLHMNPVTPLADPREAVLRAIRSPLGAPPLQELAHGRRSACIVVSDITRPVPNRLLLPPLLAELHAAGLRAEQITILIGTGIHRPNEGDELIEILGPDIPLRYPVVNHVARDPDSHTALGRTARGTPVEIDTRYVEADLKIVTGLIEPHLMAGYSGGRKGVCPGLCSINTMQVMHGVALLDSPKATYGIIEGNPFHEEATEIAEMAGVDFLLNVTLDEARRITGVFAGDLHRAFAAGVAFAEKQVAVPVPRPAEVVLTTSAGYPLDTTYYQAIKGVKGALPAVKQQGTIICAAECSEGLGSREFTALLYSMPDLPTFERQMYADGFFVIDQWQLQELVISARHAEVVFHAGGLSEQDRQHLLVPVAESVEEALAQAFERHGPNAQVIIIPEGPYVLPVPAN